MFNFKFLKQYYPEVEILELFSSSKSSLQRYRAECLKSGGDLFKDMGYFHIDGIKSAMYEPVKLSNWILENKVKVETKYSYDNEEKRKLQNGLLEFPGFKYQPKKEEEKKVVWVNLKQNGIGQI